jgi:hypothetical protein
MSPDMVQIDPALAGNPDRLRWNARYGGNYTPTFAAHPLATQALALQLPPGPMLELACGPSGSALLAASSGRHVTAVDASDLALRILSDEAARRDLGGLIAPAHADLVSWQPEAAAYALVLCTGYWDRAIFPRAAAALAVGGVLAWEGLTQAARVDRPQIPEQWCLEPGEPASLLPPHFEVISQDDVAPGTRRRLLARGAALSR